MLKSTTSSSSNWSKEKTIEFIDEVRARPSLWDVDTMDYRDRQLKKDGWQAVGQRFGIGHEEAYKKFRSLRTYAKTELKKKCAPGGKRSTWFAYDAISFVLYGGDATAAAAMDSYHTTMDMDASEAYHSEDEYKAHASLYQQQQQPPTNRPRKRTVEEEEAVATFHHPAVQIVKDDPEQMTRRRNPHSAFGEHVANKLATYNDLVRSEVELKISRVLYEADNKMFNSSGESGGGGGCPSCTRKSSAQLQDEDVGARDGETK